MRSRNIKPGFFKNELLADLDPFARLLFIGLWCLADREGRLEDRPKRIKMELFPLDGYDPETGLESLQKLGFITRYVIDDKAVIQLVSFRKHQSPHGTEKDSELPDSNGLYTVNSRGNNGQVTGEKQLVPVISPLDNVISPLDNALIPDSLIPDSLIPDKPAKPSARKRAMPDDFTVSDRVTAWATEKGYSVSRVSDNFAKFALYAKSKGAKYADWDAALMTAIRDDWAKAGSSNQTAGTMYTEYRPK